MLFFKLTVLIQIKISLIITIIADFFSGSIATDPNFVATINTFYEYIHPESVNKPSTSQGSSDVIFPSEQVFNRLENNLRVVLEQMSCDFNIKSPTSIFMEQKQTSEQVYQPLILSNNMTAFCLKIPRCLEFLFVRTHNHANVYWLYKMHRMICQTLPKLYTDKIVIDDSNYIGTLDLYKEFKKIQQACSQTFWSSREVYNETSEIFIFTLYNDIGVIDLIPFILKNNTQVDNIFEIEDQIFQKIKLMSKQNTNYDDVPLLVDSLTIINNEYLGIIESTCGESIELTENDVVNISKPWVINKMLLYTFKRIEEHFKFIQLEYFQEMCENVQSDPDQYPEIILKIVTEILFDKMCEHVPLILLYLAENNFNDTHQLFSFYFMFCGDYKDFLLTHCSVVKNDISSFLDCSIKSLKNVLYWNANTILNTVEKIDKCVDHDKCRSLNLKYIQDIYNALSNTKQYVDIWPTFNWLSGKYIFEDESECMEMHLLRDTSITVNEKSMTLAEIYYIILPWNLNMKTIFTFHNIVMQEALRNMNTFVYLQAKIIILYFEHMKLSNTKVDDEVFMRIRKTLTWYSYVKELFSVKPYLPIAYNGQKEIDSTVLQVQNLKDTAGTVNIKQYIPEYIDDTIMHLLNNIHKIPISHVKCVPFLDELALHNCNSAMTYMTAIIAVEEKSMGRNVNDLNISLKVFCGQFVTDVFKNKSPANDAQT